MKNPIAFFLTIFILLFVGLGVREIYYEMLYVKILNGECACCGKFAERNPRHKLTYQITPEHMNSIDNLCEDCWIKLVTANARLEYYEIIFDALRSRNKIEERMWPKIKLAVENSF